MTTKGKSHTYYYEITRPALPCIPMFAFVLKHTIPVYVSIASKYPATYTIFMYLPARVCVQNSLRLSKQCVTVKHSRVDLAASTFADRQ